MTGGTWHSLRCTSRFDGLGLVGPVRTTYARGPLTRHAAAPPKPRPRKPAPVTRKPRAPEPPINDGHARVLLPPTAAAKRHPSPAPAMVNPRAQKRAALRAELDSLRNAPGPAAAQRRAAIRRALAKLEENHR